MKSPILAALLLAIIWSYPASASSGGGTLTLVSDASNNKLQVTLAIPSVAASNTQTTTVTGTMNVSTDVDSATGVTLRANHGKSGALDFAIISWLS